jgi:WD40 repeat protein
LLAVGVEMLYAGMTSVTGHCVLFTSDLQQGYPLPWDHTEGTFSVAFSPDGQTLAAGSGDGTVVLWAVASRRQRAIIRHPRSQLVAFTADGQCLVTAGGVSHYTNEIKIWDSTSWKEQKTLFWQNDRSDIHCIAMAPKSRRFVTGGSQIVAVWDALTGKELVTFKVHPSLLAALAVSPDGALLATAGLNTSDPESSGVKLWELSTGKALHTFPEPSGQRVTSLAFSLDGRLLAVACQNKCVFWDLSTKAVVMTLK